MEHEHYLLQSTTCSSVTGSVSITGVCAHSVKTQLVGRLQKEQSLYILCVWKG